jgi:hypothetical protein
MIRKQFFIDEDENKRLKSAALALGKSEAELIREGVKQVLEQSQPSDDDWKVAFRRIKGMWADYPEIEDIMKERRAARGRRRDRMMRAAGTLKPASGKR